MGWELNGKIGNDLIPAISSLEIANILSERIWQQKNVKLDYKIKRVIHAKNFNHINLFAHNK